MHPVEVKHMEIEMESLREELRSIREARLVWAMACQCMCPACKTFDARVRGKTYSPPSGGTERE
jgi:hypothetical protein